MIVLNLLVTAVASPCLEGNGTMMAGFVLLLGMGLLIYGFAVPKGMPLKTRVVHGEPQWVFAYLLKGRNFRPFTQGIVEKQTSLIQRERLIGH